MHVLLLLGGCCRLALAENAISKVTSSWGLEVDLFFQA